VLLCWWADALLKVLLNQDIQARVHFMDGPFAVDVARSFGMLNFRMIARDREIGTGEAAVKPFVVGLASQSHRVLDAGPVAGMVVHRCRCSGVASRKAGAGDSTVLRKAVASGAVQRLTSPPWHPFPIFTCFGHRHRYGTL